MGETTCCVVGAGPAGAVLAYMLARQGIDVTLLESHQDFDRDFRGQVRGLGFAVYKWLVMRQGVETIKPDVHVLRFVRSAVGRQPSEAEAVTALERIAMELGLKAYELDWGIWEAGRSSREVPVRSRSEPA